MVGTPSATGFDLNETPTTVNWTNADGGNWDVGANWSSGSVPDSGDDVVINTPSPATITIQAGDIEAVASLVTAAGDTLSITGGSLTVGAGASTLNGPLAMTGGSLTASGLGTTLTATGTTTISIATLVAASGASLALPAATGLLAANITLNDGTSVTILGTQMSMPAAGTSGGTINVPSSPQLTVTLQNSGTLTSTTLNVGQGSTVALTGGTYLGTTTFNISQGATVDPNDGMAMPSAPTYGGMLTGTSTGNGAVMLSVGDLFSAVGGLTLNFAGSMFQWTGGGLFTGLGDMTNLGTINLSGANEKFVYGDGALDNFGTILQTGTGSTPAWQCVSLDGVAATTLDNEAGASYLIESDAGLDNYLGGGPVAVQNAGTIKKTAGTGISGFSVNGVLSNTGVIEADSGRLELAASSLSQVSGTTLTGGTWNALDGAALYLPISNAITSNAGTLAIGGVGAAINGIAINGLTFLATNSGSLTLTGGASFFATSGLIASTTFTNTGSLTLGPGSTLTVAHNFIQSTTGTLNEQIGGTPASGQFGKLVVTQAATLAGNFNLSLVNGFTPSRGTVYPVMTFASTSGSFATVTGVSPDFTEQVNSTSLNLVNGTGNPVVLLLSQVSAPTTATTGQQITVNWKVGNSSSNAATGNWQDSVYLSTTPAITSSALLLGSVMHGGGLVAGGSYNASLTTAVPALPPGNYYVLVQADSLDQVLVLSRAGDTLAAGTGQIAVSVPVLTLGTPISATFTAAAQDQYYQVSVPAGGALVVALASAATSGATALYVSAGTPPTPYNDQEAANVANQPNQTVTVPQVLTAGTYFILAESVSGAAATAGYTLRVTQTAALAVTGTTPSSGGNAGNVTVAIAGANFTPGTTASPTSCSTTIGAAAIDFVSASQLFFTFNLGGQAAGSYTPKRDARGPRSIIAPKCLFPGGGRQSGRAAHRPQHAAVRAPRPDRHHRHFTGI